ncbi:MAG: FtsX-like permease family protein [Candidatus Promineifilaceae bacterium]
MGSLQKATRPELSSAGRSGLYLSIPFTSLRWRKAWRDLSLHRLRSVLVILSIAVGVFTFGLILGARNTITTELHSQYLSVAPASADLHTSLIDEEMVASVGRMPEVGVAAGRLNTIVQYLDSAGEWQDLQLYARDDYQESEVNIIYPFEGEWPPGKHNILIERNSLPLIAAELGQELVIEAANGQKRALTITGLVHDMNQLPAQVTGVPYGYVSFDTLEWLGMPREFNELQIVVAEDRFDKTHITRVAEAVRDKLEKASVVVSWTEVPEPGEHLVEEFLPTIIYILTSLGLLALLLSAFLVVNVITAVVTQQQKQIGIMKSVGAKGRQIMSIYLRMVLVLGLAALLLAVPLSMLGAHEFSRFIAGQFNFDLGKLRPVVSVILLEVLAALLVPVLAALYPIRNGTRVTVREAIQDYGLEGSGSHLTPLERGIDRLPISRPLRISLRNTFRHKGRLARTLITLMLGGAIFMSVLAVRRSLYNTLEETLLSQGFDIQIQFDRPYRAERVANEAAGTPGVAVAETWQLAQGILLQDDGTDGDDLIVYALPPDTELYEPRIKAGRWLSSDDGAAVVVPMSLGSRDAQEMIGQLLTVRLGAKEEDLVVVGVLEAFQPPIVPPSVYVNKTYYDRELGGYEMANLLRVLVDSETGYVDQEVRNTLEQRLEFIGLDVRSVHTLSSDRAIFSERFNIITVILLVMASLMAVVGALGLMGTMSINVLERKREIGVMRAIGASDRAVLRIFLLEGIVIGIMSWAGAILISQPMSRLISRQVGLAFLELPLHFKYNWFGPLLWLIIVIFISALASLLPAYNAARLSVRETIAYE